MEKQPDPPSSGPSAGTPADCPTGACPMTQCPPVEIEINDTPATNDDLVLLKGAHPASRPRTRCRIRATGAGTTDTVVLTNPDGRLRFPGAGDRTKTLTVPTGGAWVSFEISGEQGSDAIGDAVIEARCMTTSGPVIGSKPVTVVHFDQPKIEVTPGGRYRLDATGRYTTTGGNAVDYSAEARVRPAGVDCSAPQLANLRIGILQNLETPYRKLKTWNAPSITWNPGVATGTRVVVPTSIRLTISVPVRTNDSESSVAPLYDQPGKSGTLDPGSLKPPKGCSGGGAATSHDTPSTPFPATFVQPAVDATGATVGQVTWTRRDVALEKQFMAWCVAFDTGTNAVVALRERPWRLFVSSAGSGPQRASAQADRAPSFDPVTAPPFGNDRTNDPRNHNVGPVGPARTTFTKP